MSRPSNPCLYLAIFLLNISLAVADFSKFAFGGNTGNSSNARKCPGISYGCEPPRVCAFDDLRNKWYCCEQEKRICWAARTKCGGGENIPSGSQQLCIWGDREYQYCCLKEPTERCTEDSKQFNICWSGFENQVWTLNATRLNETFSSMSSANPTASIYAIDRTALLAMSTTTPSSSTPTNASVTPSMTSISSPSSTLISPNPDDGNMTAGTIAGIAVGSGIGVAIVVGAGFLLWRRRKNSYTPTQDNNNAEIYAQRVSQPPVEAPSDVQYAEMPIKSQYSEMHGNRPAFAELDGNYAVQGWSR